MCNTFLPSKEPSIEIALALLAFSINRMQMYDIIEVFRETLFRFVL